MDATSSADLLMIDPGEKATALRQVSPFAGYLEPRERWRIPPRARVELLRAGVVKRFSLDPSRRDLVESRIRRDLEAIP